MKGPPNYWPEAVTRSNIINKINPDEVQGSNWDKDSIMHYPFDAGHILEPREYRTQDLVPAPGLSARDIEWIRSFYPPLEEEVVSLSIGTNNINLKPGESKVFTLKVPETSYYSIRTKGKLDTLLTLFDPYGKEIKTDDDSGYSTNAKIVEAIFTGHEYTVSTRLYWKNKAGDFRIVVEDKGISYTS